jgi:hypothetical protein
MRKLEIVLSVALATSVAVAYSLWHELHAERARTARLGAAAAAPALTPAAPATPPPAGSRAAAAASPRAETIPQTESPSHGRQEDWQSYRRRLLQDPKYLEAWREQRRLTYRLRRDNAIRLFGFSPATADAIIELDIDRELQMQESSTDAPSEEGGRQFKAKYEADEREHDSKLLALLGQERFEQWQNYMETRSTRMQVDRFRSQLNGFDLLRDDQVEPLIAALALEQKQMQSELQEFRESFEWGSDPDQQRKKFLDRQAQITKAGHKRMLEGAGSVLSPSQVRRLADMLDTDLAQRANQLRMDALREKLGPMPATEAGSD